MGLFTTKAQQWNAEIPTANQGLMNNMTGDTSAVRGLANTPITGLSAAGLAQQEFARQAFANQRDQLMNNQMSNQASGQAQMARYGADAGSAERLAQGLGRDRMFGQQRLGAQQASSMADLAQGDLQSQQDRQYTALMALPQISQNQMTNQFNMDRYGADARNQENAINVGNQEAARQANSKTWGTIGGVAGGLLGGPLGAAGGQLLGGLFGGRK